jgi:hydrogenase expression/formation protein HypC
MCLAIPGKILQTFTDGGQPMALVDYAGARNTACLAYTPEAGVGDFVIVHAGFALQVLNEQEAAASIAELSRLAGYLEHDGGTDPRGGQPFPPETPR